MAKTKKEREKLKISEKEGRKLLCLPLGAIFETKGKRAFSLNNPEIKAKSVKEPQIEDIHASATFYKVVSGKVVAYGLKIGKGA